MEIFFTQPWDNNKNIGVYYNKFMSMLPDDGWGCLMDSDAMFLTNDYGVHLYRYAQMNPHSTFVCRTNRLGCNYQRLDEVDQNNHDINYHRKIAYDRQSSHLYNLTSIANVDPAYLFGGVLILISKKNWKDVGGFKEDGMLGIDNDLHLKLMAHNKPIFVMEGIYIYHWYRADGKKDHVYKNQPKQQPKKTDDWV